VINLGIGGVWYKVDTV